MNKPELTVRQLGLSVKIQRNYGRHAIEFGIQEVVEVDNGGDRHLAYENLIAQLSYEIEQYELTHLNDVRPAQQQEERQKTEGNVTVPITHISHNFQNNKHIYRGHGGKWSRYGVPIYPECQMAWELDELPLGDFPMPTDGYFMVCNLEGGQPKRVVRIQDHA